MTCPRDTAAGQGRSGMASLTNLPPPPARSRLPGFGPFCPGAGGLAWASGVVQRSGAFSDAVLTPGPAGWGAVKSVPWWGFGEGGALGPRARSVYSMLLIEAINHGHGQLAQTGASFSFSYPEPKTRPGKLVGTRALDVVTCTTGVSLLLRAPPRCPGLSSAPDTVAGAQ